MTTTYPGPAVSAVSNVYQPQDDSRLLVNVMQESALIPGRRVLDLCTGSGFVAIAAAEMGGADVTAFDICPHAVGCSRGNAAAVGVNVDVRKGTWSDALDCAPFDVVVSNPPYVPTPPNGDTEYISPSAGPSWAWNAGPDGRMVLDPLCEAAPKLLCDGGSLLLVHSALAGVRQSLDSLKWAGMDAKVIASKWIPFGPVMTARANWLESVGLIPRGRREEELIVIRADKR
ncbi:methylase [Mycobacterium sp. 852002-53434_SCH5985345]|uniref:HemK2/MTQ2 family protein methyltransferase n=1 Tax=unclassified Mycobacterium TaxID=2642494 RepID=UPI0007FE8163|nr:MULTISPECIES: HemK2/MTQ2 family protein methyltransferase [unclassified Mycobacterium]OBF51897.1 methylase [Mycobacterium sp. 852002-53434_SCH5985345]OBF74611.1 methylase [Mycobacterium sp. 852002-51613_SCH5001154]OBG01099.1 methylase [Mycobacterium sp. 852014-52450_SCH5900713]